MRQSYTAVVERNQSWHDDFATEPYEAAWATEAIFFVRVLQAENMDDGVEAHVQISPDGIHWCDEGTALMLPHAPGLSFAKISHFGGWLRLGGNLPNSARLTVLVYLVLKE